MRACPNCNGKMAPLFTGMFCVNECDRPGPVKKAPDGVIYCTRFDGARCVVVSRVDDIPLNATEGLWIDAANKDATALAGPKTPEQAMSWTKKIGPNQVAFGYRAWQECPRLWAQDLATFRYNYENSFAKGYKAAYVIPGN